MKIKNLFLIVVFSFLFSAQIFGETILEISEKAVSANETESKSAINQLRLLKQKGLDALFEKYGKEIENYSREGQITDDWKRIALALDSVALQKDAYSSRLFWYTDLEEAKKISRETKKPILSLRLLGNLNEEFSCANSRLFRAILYSNDEISQFLRENYVLHWQSVRPAPKVTIDYGDGRKIERTITGNSIHYVLDSNGKIIDALPGLYSPQSFLNFLKESFKTFSTPSQPNLYERQRLAKYREISSKRTALLTSAKIKLTEPEAPKISLPTATEAAPLAVSKMAVTSEISILSAVFDDFSKYQPQLDLSDWEKLSGLYASNAKIDAKGLAFISRQTRQTINDKQFSQLIKRVETFIALDTTRNDFLIRPQIYQLLSQNPRFSLDRINEEIYSKVFLTPNSDEWLGLYSPSVYTALDGNGVIR